MSLDGVDSFLRERKNRKSDKLLILAEIDVPVRNVDELLPCRVGLGAEIVR